ncbi:MAG: aldo/keto reductase [Bacteroidetes bacterium]|jgi:aryl-alcohol dehydrogenase-like predicted oxidoreductase|nr:aldo/keto reductase [Bacteroidota bacterium]
MQYAELGRTGIEISKIGLGTMTYGEQNNREEAYEQIEYALDQGVNFIDTAEMYSVPSRKETKGETERILGAWLKYTPNRNKVVLATKVTGPSANMTYIRNPLRFTPGQIRMAVEGSLKRLRTDYIDLYQLHWPERNTNCFGQRGYKHNPDEEWKDNIFEVLRTMGRLVDEGKIRFFGLSNETPWGTMRFLQAAEMEDLPRPVSIQNPYSLLNRTFEVGLAEVAMREKCGLLAYSPLAFGLLSGKYHRGEAQSRDRLNRFKQMSRYNSKQSYEATQKYLAIAQEHGLSLTQMALAFINQQPFVTSNIIGATTMEQLKENISSIDVELPAELMQAIEEVHETIPNPAP